MTGGVDDDGRAAVAYLGHTSCYAPTRPRVRDAFMGDDGTMARIAVRSVATLMLLGSLLVAPAAHAITGTLSGDYGEFLNTSECGAASASGSFTLTLSAGGKWRLVDESGDVLAGRYVADSSQRNLSLSLNSRSESYMVELVRSTASRLCNAKAKVSSYSKPSIRIRLAAKFSTATGSMSFTVRGKTKFGAGSAKYTANFLRARFRRKS